MSRTAEGYDWEICGVAQMGGVVGVGAGVWWFMMRSRVANSQGKLILTAAGIGAGGSMGGGTAPSPGDVIYNRQPDLWTRVPCMRPFSLDDMNWTYGAVTMASAGAAYGYSITRITAGFGIQLFRSVSVGGWGTGVGLVGGMFPGVWKVLESSDYTI